MNKITAIEPQSRFKNRRSIFINGQFAFGVDEEIVAALGLRVGQAVRTDDLDRVVRAESVRKAREAALTLLDYRPRSVSEMRRRLLLKGHTEDIVDQVLQNLQKVGLLDDERFAAQWVEERLTHRPMGRRAVTFELKRKGISNDLIDRAVEGIGEDAELEMALDLAARRYRADAEDQLAEKRRVASLLRRRGFGWDVVTRVLDRLSPEGGQLD